MKVVLDTNTIISALFWKGAPRQVLDLARFGKITLFTTPELLAELSNILERDKFAQRLVMAKVTVDELVYGYAALSRVIRPVKIQPVIAADPDDDRVLACALAAKAQAIVSDDSHLMNLGTFEGIMILTSHQLLEQFQ